MDSMILMTALMAIAAVFTAIATCFLVWVTKVLAVETRRLVDVSSKPHVVVTLEPNHASITHIDIEVENTGTGTAYDVDISFVPSLSESLTLDQGLPTNKVAPFQHISVLKPGQSLSSYLTSYRHLEKKVFGIHVKWRRAANSLVQESNTYTIDMSHFEGMIKLDGNDSLEKIAGHIKGMRDDWQRIARGRQRLEIDTYTAGDRLHERRLEQRRKRQFNEEQARQENSKLSDAPTIS